jgi:transcription elongation factor Elf1
MSQHRASVIGAPAPDDFTEDDLAVECPFCGNVVDHPGMTRTGSKALAECDHCDIYFDFGPTDVVTSTDWQRLVAVA